MYRTEVCGGCNGTGEGVALGYKCSGCNGRGYIDIDLGPWKSGTGKNNQDVNRSGKAISWSGLLFIAVLGAVGVAWLAWQAHLKAKDDRISAYKKLRSEWNLEALNLTRPGHAVLVLGMSEKRYMIRAKDAAEQCGIPSPVNEKINPNDKSSGMECFRNKLCDQSQEERIQRIDDYNRLCFAVDKQMTRDEYFACVRDKLDCSKAVWKLLDLVQ